MSARCQGRDARRAVGATAPTQAAMGICAVVSAARAQFLSEVSPKGLHAVFERFRSILHEAQIDKR